MLELGIITDEIGDDIAHAAARARAWGIDLVELRTVGGRNLLELDDAGLDAVERALSRSELRVSAIASPVFKSPRDGRPRAVAADFALPGSESMESQLALLERACALATRFGAGMVRVFTFWREDGAESDAPAAAGVSTGEAVAAGAALNDGALDETVLADLVAKLGRAAEVARRHGVVLAVENEPVCVIGTGRELGRLCGRLAGGLAPELRPHVAALWDPGNALAGGEARPYPDGYDALGACRVAHVHLKDLVLEPGGGPRFVPLGEGRVAYPEQFDALLAGGYRGAFVLEPHYRPAGLSREEAASACVEAARDLLDAARERAGV